MNAERFMVNQLLWESRNGQDGHGQPRFDLPKTLNCRHEPSRRYVLNDKGETILTDSKIMCMDLVSVGDRITIGSRKRIVLTEKDFNALNGDLLYREVMV